MGTAGLRILFLVLMIAARASAEFSYVTNDDAITITGYTGPGGAVVIPSMIAGLPVSIIEHGAFYGCTNLNEVVIPDSVAIIGNSAFYHCTGLTNLILGKGVAFLGEYAFAGCGRLTDFTIPDSLVYVGWAAFAGCRSLRDIAVPDSVIFLEDGAFSKCDALTNCVIGNGVSKIAGLVFAECPNLSSITLGRGITNVSPSYIGGPGTTGIPLFETCPNLREISVDSANAVYSSADGVLFNKERTSLVRCPAGKIGNYTVPAPVRWVEQGAFLDCTNLSSIIISDTVISIADYAFQACINLTNLIISDNVTNIGHSAFLTCLSLSSVIIPDSVIEIGVGAFHFCPSLTDIVIGRNVTSIGSGAFSFCNDLLKIHFKGTPPALGSDVFLSANNAIIYYLPSTTGWSSTFGGRPTALWKPQIQTGDASFTAQTNGFGYNIDWASGMAVVIEASTNPTAPVWLPLQTNTLTADSFYFSDPDWTNYPARFYRVRWP